MKSFGEGARVAMIGDSITHAGQAVAHLQEYYLSQFPARHVKIYNLGIAGGSAAEALTRMDDILSVQPTEAVVMFGVNDMGIWLYGEKPTAAERAEREENRRRHLEATVQLVRALTDRGLPVTLCSSVGRDEHTAGEEGTKTFGATEALHAMFLENIAAIGTELLKNTVDVLSPMQQLQQRLCHIGGPSLFAPDRTHPNALGQAIMARILLQAQGLAVSLPSAEDIAAGFREKELSFALSERHAVEQKWRDLLFVHPHQGARVQGLDLDARIAFWKKEAEREDLALYFVEKYTFYAENAKKENAFREEYLARTDALYE